MGRMFFCSEAASLEYLFMQTKTRGLINILINSTDKLRNKSCHICNQINPLINWILVKKAQEF